MSRDVRYPTNAIALEEIRADVSRVVCTETRLPDWPFKHPRSNVDICQYGPAVDGGFGPVIHALSEYHADEYVSLVVLDPAPHYYLENYGSFPAFMVPTSSLATDYWRLLSYEPNGDPTGAITYTANVVALAGGSGLWGVWAERSWDLAMISSGTSKGPWLHMGIDFVPVEEALTDFTEPDFKTPLDDDVRERFLNNFRHHGSVG